jgi:hypothetical protein
MRQIKVFHSKRLGTPEEKAESMANVWLAENPNIKVIQMHTQLMHEINSLIIIILYETDDENPQG